MELNGWWQVFLGGALGAVLVELVKLGTSRDRIPVKYTRTGYWLATLALWFVSGVGAVIHGVEEVPLFRAVQLGVTAPALIAGWASGSTARKQRQAQKPPVVGAGAKPVPYLGEDAKPESFPTEAPKERAAGPPTTFDLLGW